MYDVHPTKLGQVMDRTDYGILAGFLALAVAFVYISWECAINSGAGFASVWWAIASVVMFGSSVAVFYAVIIATIDE